jgi:hypothetical protein
MLLSLLLLSPLSTLQEIEKQFNVEQVGHFYCGDL